MTIHSDIVNIWLPNAQKTRLAGEKLAKTLYSLPTALYVSGELGAGKTTFIQGLAAGLGIEGHVTSPTFALEQRYQTKNGALFSHLDLYRLTKEQAVELLRSAEDTGVRCIEWSERAGITEEAEGIHISLKEKRDGRELRIAFRDIPTPSTQTIAAWRKKVMLSDGIIAHCEQVAAVCDALAEILLERGEPVRPLALHRAAQAHDLLRFVDFKEGANTSHVARKDSAKELSAWQEIRERFPGLRHEQAATMFLQSEGYAALGAIVEPHGLRLPPASRATPEQQLLFYADKRVAGDQVVTLEERFDDFVRRYGPSDKREEWFLEAKNVESYLFGSEPDLTHLTKSKRKIGQKR